MGWTKMDPHKQAEPDLQEYMEQWPASPPGWSRAGAPSWLRGMTNLRYNQRFKTGLGYSFEPDLSGELPDGPAVLELKCAGKYEPLALAECLHHAWWLSRMQVKGSDEENRTYTPVLFTQSNFWLRAAIQFLHDNGLSKRSIKFIEFTALRVEDERFLWLEEPFAGWELCSAKPHLPEGLDIVDRHWYKVNDAETWIAVQSQSPVPPGIWTQPYVMLTRLEENKGMLTWDGAPGAYGRHLLWRSGIGNLGNLSI
jgi:hypothetical protein